jgi:hypothetical protein
MVERRLSAAAMALGLSVLLSSARVEARVQLGVGADAWQASAAGAVRGITVGPIESALHPDRGYGSAACARTMSEARRLGATWVSVTPFGRVWNLTPSGVSLTFEQPFKVNRAAVKRAVAQAHAEGLKVLIVPHLWVETGDWRALIDPATDEDWERWAKSYHGFLREWALVAKESGAEMFSLGVELRSFVTTARASRFLSIVRDIRRLYPGLLTYAANWDDVDRTVILGELDVIGLNAFYPLAEREGADLPELVAGGRKVAERLRELAHGWGKPVVFTEFGYTTRRDPAVRPWEWPEALKNVVIDEVAQANAYRALLGAFVDEPWFAGFFVWRYYADPDDVSQEAEWGFSPRGKLAELVLHDAFAAHWAADGPRPLGAALHRHGARHLLPYSLRSP